MKTRLSLLMLLIFGLSQAQENTNIQVLAESRLSIKGTTNVNTFRCAYSAQNLKRSLTINYTQQENQMLFERLKLFLDNSGFDCGNRGINKDFHELLQTETYPQIEFELLSYNNQQQKATVAITIAGETNTYSLPVNLLETHQIKGLLRIDITDYGLTPPKKMLGMIVVHKEIEIAFSFVIKTLG